MTIVGIFILTNGDYISWITNEIVNVRFSWGNALGRYKFVYKTNVCEILPVFYLKVMKAVVIRDFVIAKKKGKW